jgi:hypothetical protein
VAREVRFLSRVCLALRWVRSWRFWFGTAGRGWKCIPYAVEFELHWLPSAGHCRLGIRHPTRTLSGFLQFRQLVSAWRCLLQVPLWCVVVCVMWFVCFIQCPMCRRNFEVSWTFRMQDVVWISLLSKRGWLSVPEGGVSRQNLFAPLPRQNFRRPVDR